MLDELGLEILGFECHHASDKANYLAEYPQHIAATWLSNRQIYEKAHPSTLASTYRFWVKRHGSAGAFRV
ncbi:MAG: hypothetical protein L0Z68_05240 [Gammaproteobacteria bacterium]|nr:hypothetical protein [Gammaproteobacteria bacterium]